MTGNMSGRLNVGVLLHGHFHFVLIDFRVILDSHCLIKLLPTQRRRRTIDRDRDLRGVWVWRCYSGDRNFCGKKTFSTAGFDFRSEAERIVESIVTDSKVFRIICLFNFFSSSVVDIHVFLSQLQNLNPKHWTRTTECYLNNWVLLSYTDIGYIWKRKIDRQINCKFIDTSMWHRTLRCCWIITSMFCF